MSDYQTVTMHPEGPTPVGTFTTLRSSELHPAPENPPYRVLLVDDVKEERELLRTWLEETTRFVIVGEAEDARRGVAMAADLSPDLVTLDMSMPGGDGISALRQILANQTDCKVVVVSGYVTTDLVHMTVDLIGASACIDKGIGSSQLVDKLIGVVEERANTHEPTSNGNGPAATIDLESLASARLAAIVDSSFDAIISMNLDGVITSWNAAAEQLYESDADEIIGRNVTVLITPDRIDELIPPLERIRRGERVKNFETTRLRKDGSQLHTAISLSPIRNASGAVVGSSAISRDITERRLAQAELARQAADLRRSNSELEQFAYVASHDLSEPLRTISGYVELLARRYQGQIDEDADRFIKHAVNGCARMKQLIDDLLTYSQAGRRAELTAAVDCTGVVNEALSAMSATLAKSGGQVDCTALPTVRGDRSQLVQLFQNLISNSLKFARQGVPPRIHIEAHRDDRTWTFSVSDNGIGIEPAYRERVFGMFQRLHARDDYPGTGIGLAICMRIVEAHHGLIWVDDNKEAGSRFSFTLSAVEPISGSMDRGQP